jgi:hypothetical protein
MMVVRSAELIMDMLDIVLVSFVAPLTCWVAVQLGCVAPIQE